MCHNLKIYIELRVTNDDNIAKQTCTIIQITSVNVKVLQHWLVMAFKRYLSKWKIFSILCHFIMKTLRNEERLQIVVIYHQNLCFEKCESFVTTNIVVIIDLVNQQCVLLPPNFAPSLLSGLKAYKLKFCKNCSTTSNFSRMGLETLCSTMRLIFGCNLFS